MSNVWLTCEIRGIVWVKGILWFSEGECYNENGHFKNGRGCGLLKDPLRKKLRTEVLFLKKKNILGEMPK